MPECLPAKASQGRRDLHQHSKNPPTTKEETGKKRISELKAFLVELRWSEQSMKWVSRQRPNHLIRKCLYLSNSQNSDVGTGRSRAVPSAKYAIEDTGETLHENPPEMRRNGAKRNIHSMGDTETCSEWLGPQAWSTLRGLCTPWELGAGQPQAPLQTSTPLQL